MAKFRSKRLTVTENDDINVSNDLCDVLLTDVIARFVALQKKHGDGAILTIEAESEPYGDYTSIECRVHSSHPETDDEYEARRTRHDQHEANQREAAKQNRKRRVANEKREYARLKKKFEKK